MNRYSLILEIIFYNMGNNFIYLQKTRLSQVTYYRLLLPIFINLKRILYLDGDTLNQKMMIKQQLIMFYSIAKLEEVIKNPTIIHHVICGPKIWKKTTTYFGDITNCYKRNNCSCIKYHYIWLYFANKTDYYKEILPFTEN